MEARWLRSDPGDKLLNLRVGAEEREGVVLAFELFFGEDRVHHFVAGTAEAGDARGDIGTVEVALVALIRVAGARDEMMAGEGDFRAAAEFAHARHSYRMRAA